MIEARKNRMLSFTIECKDPEQVLRVGHDGKEYWFGVYEKSELNDDHEPVPVYASDDYTKRRFDPEIGDYVEGTQFNHLAHVIAWTSPSVNWHEVDKNVRRTLNSAAGSRADEVIHIIAEALESPEEKEKKRLAKAKEWATSLRR